MLTVKAILQRVRTRIHDEQAVGYSDENLLEFLNDGVSVLRRLIITINPMLLQEEVAGTLHAGKDAVTLSKPVSRLVKVLVNQAQVLVTSRPMIDDEAQTGTPRYCYLAGVDCLRFFPKDTQNHRYIIDYIPDMELLTLEDDSPFLTDLDQVLVEYVAIRAAMSDEYSLSDEQGVLSSVLAQAEQLVRDLAPMEVQAKGYWDDGDKSMNDAWNHHHMYRWKW